MFFSGLFCGFRAVRLRRASFRRGHWAAGGGGGAGSSYFKYSAPSRKLQGGARRHAGRGGSRVLRFGLEFKLAISLSGKRRLFGIPLKIITTKYEICNLRKEKHRGRGQTGIEHPSAAC